MSDELILILFSIIIILLLYIIVHNWKSFFYWFFKAVLTICGGVVVLLAVILFLDFVFNFNTDSDSPAYPDMRSVRSYFDQDFSRIKRKSLAARHNNPGNLRPVNSQTGFRQFPDMESGYKALIHDLEAKISGRSKFTSGDETLEELIYIYAPPSENNSHAYVSKVAAMLKVGINEPIKKMNVHQLAKAIIYVEDIRLYKRIFSTSEKQQLIIDTIASKQ